MHERLDTDVRRLFVFTTITITGAPHVHVEGHMFPQLP